MTIKERNNMILFAAAFGIIMAMMYTRRSSQHPETNFAKLSVIGQGKPVLLELGGQGCPGCEAMMPILAEVDKKYSKQFTIAYHDVWKDPSIGEKYGLSIIPTQIFIDKDGKELFRHEGVLSKAEILAKWKELGIEIP
jgi:thiol-disulfide isomerase/thioredoxin